MRYCLADCLRHACTAVLFLLALLIILGGGVTL